MKHSEKRRLEGRAAIDSEERREPELPHGGKAQGCVFCRIVRHAAESYVVFEDETSLAFLDWRPLFPGHTLIVPKTHWETLADLPHDLVSPLFSNAQLLAVAVVEATASEGSFVAINNRISQGVPHLHIHIVPRNRNDGLKGFFWPRHPYQSREAILEAQKAVRSAAARLQASKGKERNHRQDR
jgi:histidine triad (HIT) family protein